MEVTNTIGRRKTSIARVYVKPGKGTIVVNDRELKDYFQSEIHQTLVKQPLAVTQQVENFDVLISVEGDGIKGQAEAVRLGIARALAKINAESRPALKKEGF